METVMSWQLMTRGSAQAGNRASKTGRYLQWLENRPEWHAVTSAGGQLVQLHPFFNISSRDTQWNCLVEGVVAFSTPAVEHLGSIRTPVVEQRLV